MIALCYYSALISAMRAATRILYAASSLSASCLSHLQGRRDVYAGNITNIHEWTEETHASSQFVRPSTPILYILRERHLTRSTVGRDQDTAYPVFLPEMGSRFAPLTEAKRVGR